MPDQRRSDQLRPQVLMDVTLCTRNPRKAPALSFRSSAATNGGRHISSCSLSASEELRMLRLFYIPQESCRFSTVAAPLAQLLHCMVESVACPMDLCADADSLRCGPHFGDMDPGGAFEQCS